MSLTSAARQYFFESPPRAGQLAVPGSIVTVVTSTSASYIQLNTLFPQTPASTTLQGQNQNNAYANQLAGVCDQFITVYADTSNIGYVTGKLVTDVTTQGTFYNAPSLTVAGTLANGVYTLPAQSSGTPGGACMIIPSGTSKRFRITSYQDLFLGFVAAGSGYIRIYQSSQSDA